VSIVKKVKIFLTVIAGLWTIGVVIGVAGEWMKGTLKEAADWVASFAAIAVCVAITACLYESAFKKTAEKAEPTVPDVPESRD
jgi:hypothetical protein